MPRLRGRTKAGKKRKEGGIGKAKTQIRTE
jgi:hypothetical protein